MRYINYALCGEVRVVIIHRWESISSTNLTALSFLFFLSIPEK